MHVICRRKDMQNLQSLAYRATRFLDHSAERWASTLSFDFGDAHLHGKHKTASLICISEDVPHGYNKGRRFVAVCRLFLVRPLVISTLHTVKWFPVLLSNTDSFICTQLNGFKFYHDTLTVQWKFSIVRSNSEIPLLTWCVFARPYFFFPLPHPQILPLRWIFCLKLHNSGTELDNRLDI